MSPPTIVGGSVQVTNVKDNSDPGSTNSVATNTTTADATLHFASTPSWIVNGMPVSDATTPSVIPAGTTVSSTTGTTVVMSNNATGAGVGNGDTIVFNGVAGVTGVVFYVGSISYQNGAFSTVSATNQGNGRWTANLSATDLTTLHAVAVDGSGNFTDCAGNAVAYGCVYHIQNGYNNWSGGY
jgi:hypothetical protein